MRRNLDVQTEEELLQLQEELLSGRVKASAKVTRIGGKNKKESRFKARRAEKENEKGQAKEAEEKLQHSKPEMPSIVGEVMERDTNEDPSLPPMPVVPAASGFPASKSQKLSKFALGRKQKKQNPLTHTDGTVNEPKGNGVSSPMEEIDEENRARIAAMTDQEIKETQEELASRLSPQAIQFLKSRHTLKKGKETKQQPPSQSSDQPTTIPNTIPEPPSLISNEDSEFPSLAARLRFDAEANVVGILTKEEWECKPSSKQRALERDVLRQDEGSVPDAGYTIVECCTLCLSRVVGQRQFGAKVLKNVLEQARMHSAGDLDAWGGMIERDVDVDLNVPVEVCKEGKVEWVDVWKHAVVEVDVGGLALSLLNDRSSSVVFEAIGLVAALCGITVEDDLVYEVADANPISGWPIVSHTPLTRTHPGGVWEASLPFQTDANPPSEAPDAKLPVCHRLVQMGLLDCFERVLQIGSVKNGFKAMLPVLFSCARGGVDMAMCVIKCKQICGVLHSHLKVKMTEVGQDGGESGVHALRLVRILLQAGKEVANELEKKDFLALVKQHVGFWLKYRKSDMATPPSDHQSRLLMKLEALRIWRVCCAYGIYIVSFDDMFPLLCHDLSYPDTTFDHAELDAVNLWETWSIPREVYLLLASAVSTSAMVERKEPRRPVVLSVGCGAVLAQEARKWLETDVLEEVWQLWKKAGTVTHSPKLSCCHLYPSHPALMCSAKTLGIGCVSAVVNFLACYWSLSQKKPPDLWTAVRLRLVDAVLGNARDGVAHMGNTDSLVLCHQSAAMGSLLIALSRLARALGVAGSDDAFKKLTASVLGIFHTLKISHKTTMDTPVALETAALTRFQAKLHFANTVVSLLETFHLQARQSKAQSTGGGDGQRALWAVELGLYIQTELPPGFETLAVRGLIAVLNEDLLMGVLNRACVECKSMITSNVSLACMLPSPEFMGNEYPVGNLDHANVCNTLVSSYAASWLSLLPGELLDSTEHQDAKSSFVQGIECPYVTHIVGSRLPLTMDWMTVEAFSLPSECESSSNVLDVHPVAAALFLTLGMELAGSDLVRHLEAGEKLKNVIHLVYMTRPDELYAQRSAGVEEVWQDAGVRCALICLTLLYCNQMKGSGDCLSRHVGEGFVSKLVEVFASSSYGDGMFARHVALLLCWNGKEGVVRTAWRMLQDEGVLHFLPSLDDWFGGREWYVAGEYSRKLKGIFKESLEGGHLVKAFKCKSGAAEYGSRMSGAGDDWEIVFNDSTPLIAP